MKVTNRDIFMGSMALQNLSGIKVHIRTSLALAKLSIELNEKRKPIEVMRLELVDRFAEKDEEGKIKKLPNGNAVLSDPAGFQKAYDELMDLEESVSIEAKIKLPEVVAATCDKCHHNMDKPFEIEPAILSLLLPFVEVA